MGFGLGVCVNKDNTVYTFGADRQTADCNLPMAKQKLVTFYSTLRVSLNRLKWSHDHDLIKLKSIALTCSTESSHAK